MERLHVVIAILAICIVSTSVLGMATYLNSIKLGGRGLVKVIGVEIYDDISCTIPTLELAWGTLNPGDSQNHTCYLKNVGSVDIIITMTVSDFVPANASDFLHLIWSYNNEHIAPSNSIAVTFTLLVDSDIHDIFGFSFMVTIDAVSV